MEYIKDKTWLVKVPEIVYNQVLSQAELGVIDIIPSSIPSSSNKKTLPRARCRLAKNFKAQNFNIVFEPTECYIAFKEKKNKACKIKKIDYFGRFVASDDNVSDNVTKQVTKEQISNTPLVVTDTSKGRLSFSYNQNNINSIANSLNKKKINKKEIPVKKMRMPAEDLKTEIFNLFNDENYLTAKEIGRKLEQPDSYLKQILNEICDYIRTGPKKGYYELKRQFLRSDDSRNQNANISIDEN